MEDTLKRVTDKICSPFISANNVRWATLAGQTLPASHAAASAWKAGECCEGTLRGRNGYAQSSDRYYIYHIKQGDSNGRRAGKTV